MFVVQAPGDSEVLLAHSLVRSGCGRGMVAVAASKGPGGPFQVAGVGVETVCPAGAEGGTCARGTRPSSLAMDSVQRGGRGE